MVRGYLLKGSVCSVIKCFLIVEKSTVVSDVGSFTGLVMKIPRRGSRNSSGASSNSYSSLSIFSFSDLKVWIKALNLS
jgi:hypothetical protein